MIRKIDITKCSYKDIIEYLKMTKKIKDVKEMKDLINSSLDEITPYEYMSLELNLILIDEIKDLKRKVEELKNE